MVDYKKWDRFVADLSENDSDDDEKYSAPIVRSFDKGESIEISKSGYKVKEESKEPILELSEPFAANTDSLLKYDELVLNGGICDQFLWNQDRHQVSLSIPIEESVRGKDLKVSIENSSLRITGPSETHVILDRRLQFAIEIDVDADTVDWEIISCPSAIKQKQKYIRVVLKKKSPIPGAIFWWKNVFEGDPEIDVTKIGGRNVQKSSEVASAWKVAHEKFSESVLNREKIDVDI
eukprot:gene23798-32186_t